MTGPVVGGGETAPRMTLVFLHGPAAAGKLTSARALAAELGYPVFHNHLVVDLLTTVFPFGSEGFVRLREQTWLSVFAEAAAVGRSLVFTFAPEPTVVPGFAERARVVVEKGGGRVCFVALQVSRPEQLRRVTEPSRREFHKLSDPSLLHPGDPPPERLPIDLAVDTEASPPARTAASVIGHFGLRPEAPTVRYPG